MENNKQLSIVMTVYNDEPYLRESLEGLINQTYKDFTLLISDDCSTDASSKICGEYAQKDERIRYVRQKDNLGSYLNFKYVMDNVNTPFVMQCAGHDVYDKHFIEKLLPIIQEQKDIVLVYPKTQRIKLDRSLGNIYDDNYTTTQINKPNERYLSLIKKLQVGTPFQGIWKTDILKNRLYFANIISGDKLMLLYASLKGKFQQYPSVLFFMRMNRPSDNGDDMFKRQIKMLRGKNSKLSQSLIIFKSLFIWECLKMICEEKNIKLLNKIKPILSTLYFSVRKFYIVPIYLKTKKFLKKD